MAAVVGSLSVGVVLAATSERARADYHSVNRVGDVVIEYSGKDDPNGPRPVPSQALATLRSLMPVEQVHRIGRPACGPVEEGDAAVDGGTDEVDAVPVLDRGP